MVLIADCKTPYLFRHIDDVLRMREPRVIQELADAKKRASTAKLKDIQTWGNVYSKLEEECIEKLEAELKDIQRRKGTSDAWQLLGEAYVEGAMGGEVAEKMRERLCRFPIV